MIRVTLITAQVNNFQKYFLPFNQRIIWRKNSTWWFVIFPFKLFKKTGSAKQNFWKLLTCNQICDKVMKKWTLKRNLDKKIEFLAFEKNTYDWNKWCNDPNGSHNYHTVDQTIRCFDFHSHFFDCRKFENWKDPLVMCAL